LDERLGIEGRTSPHARRLVCLAAASWSYDLASERLQEFCGLTISDASVRKLSQEAGAEMLVWQRTAPEAVQSFREAVGDVEFTTDGTSVNTVEGWREMKVGLFSKRKRGEAATADQWDTRTLPAPEATVAFCAIESSDEFGTRWKAWRKRLGLTDASGVTVLSDGAKWIWEEQRKHLTQAEGVLDVFHVLEHVAQTSRDLFGETAAGAAWSVEARRILLEAGWDGMRGWLASTRTRTRTRVGRQSLKRLEAYLSPHAGHLGYSARLSAGQSIGSGQVEGACKNLVGRRLKANSARWKVRRVNRMAGLCAIMYSRQWTAYWKVAAP
jgi:hypothetical protein